MKIQSPQTVQECIGQFEQELSGHDLFFGHGTDNPGSEAQWLVLSVLADLNGQDTTLETVVSAEQLAQMKVLLYRRINEKVPMAYLLQEAWFAGSCFYVDERVLVPRSPIAELIENHFQPMCETDPHTILDLCCGSGCIGIACALAFPDSRVVLADISGDALAVAEINIRRFGLESRVSTCQSDLLAAITDKFDLIVSNPPYVPAREYQQLPAEYHREPHIGLVSEQEGLEIPIQILSDSVNHLNDEGLLILETGYTWPALQKALPELPFLWLDFEFGGEGVSALTAEQLSKVF